MRVSAGALAAKLRGTAITNTLAASRSAYFHPGRFMLPFRLERVLWNRHPIEVPRDADKKRTEQTPENWSMF